VVVKHESRLDLMLEDRPVSTRRERLGDTSEVNSVPLEQPALSLEKQKLAVERLVAVGELE